MGKDIDWQNGFPIYGYESPILIAKEKGCISIPLEIRLPPVYTLDASEYRKLNELSFNVIEIMGENTLIHKQDLFFHEHYNVDPVRIDRDFFEFSDELHFQNREYHSLRSYLCIHWVPKKYIRRSPGNANNYLSKKKDFYLDNRVPSEYLDAEKAEIFEGKVESINDLLNESGLISSTIMDHEALFGTGGYYDMYLEASGKEGRGNDISFEKNGIRIGDKLAQFHTLENLDQFTSEAIAGYGSYGKFKVGDNDFPVSNLFSLGLKFPYEHVINQYIYIPEKDKALKGLKDKQERLQKFSSDKKGDTNSNYANQIGDFREGLINDFKEMVYYHLNVMGLARGEKEFRKMNNALGSSFKKVGIRSKVNTIDRKNLFLAGILGNAIGSSIDMYSPMSSDMAASMLYMEGPYENPVHGEHGVRLVDRISGKPLLVSVYREPENLEWIFNRGMIVASGSGGGKTFWANTYVFSELREGGEALIMEDGNSYDKLIEVFGGVIVQNSPENPFTFNPFMLDSYDLVLKDGIREVTDYKKLQIRSVLSLLLGKVLSDPNTSLSTSITYDVIEILVDSYYKVVLSSVDSDVSFNGFFDFMKSHLGAILSEANIRKEIFDPNIFLFSLSKYAHKGPSAHLLNSSDRRLAELSKEKLVYFKLQNLIENEELFPIVAFLLMGIFDKKLMDESKLHINKILQVDEAWKLFDNPVMAKYFDGQSRMARKFGGQPIFISQKVDDFVKSEHIGKSLIVNSHIKALLDLREFAESFDEIGGILGLNDKQKQNVLTINRDLPDDRNLRDIALCWKDRINVFGIECSAESKCIYETNPGQKAKINKIHKQNGGHWISTASTYAKT